MRGDRNLTMAGEAGSHPKKQKPSGSVKRWRRYLRTTGRVLFSSSLLFQAEWRSNAGKVGDERKFVYLVIIMPLILIVVRKLQWAQYSTTIYDGDSVPTEVRQCVKCSGPAADADTSAQNHRTCCSGVRLMASPTIQYYERSVYAFGVHHLANARGTGLQAIDSAVYTLQ